MHVFNYRVYEFINQIKIADFNISFTISAIYSNNFIRGIKMAILSFCITRKIYFNITKSLID